MITVITKLITVMQTQSHRLMLCAVNHCNLILKSLESRITLVDGHKAQIAGSGIEGERADQAAV